MGFVRWQLPPHIVESLGPDVCLLVDSYLGATAELQSGWQRLVGGPKGCWQALPDALNAMIRYQTKQAEELDSHALSPTLLLTVFDDRSTHAPPSIDPAVDDVAQALRVANQALLFHTDSMFSAAHRRIASDLLASPTSALSSFRSGSSTGESVAQSLEVHNANSPSPIPSAQLYDRLVSGFSVHRDTRHSCDALIAAYAQTLQRISAELCAQYYSRRFKEELRRVFGLDVLAGMAVSE